MSRTDDCGARAASPAIPSPLACLASARYISAPMVNQSDVAWRLLARRHGAHLVYTQMLESDRFVQDEQYRREMFVTCAADRPLIVQFCANKPETFAAAAKIVEPYCDGVDLNLGCPQRAARSGLYGAYLLDAEHHPLILSMLHAARAAGVRVPICAKIRLLPSIGETIQLCRQLALHADVITVHGRTRGFVEERRKGPADLQQIQRIVAALHREEHTGGALSTHTATDTPESESSLSPPAPSRRVLFWSNGNVRCDGDVESNLAFTAADGYMVGEALLNDPTLFERCDVRQPGTSHARSALHRFDGVDSLISLAELDRKIAIIEEYIQLLQNTSADGYYAPFDIKDNASILLPCDDTVAPSVPSTSFSSLLASADVSDATFRTPLVSWASFHSHLYRLLNADTRARFLHHAQLTDEFLDAASIGEVRAVMREVRVRLADGRPFDTDLQTEIDARRSARQQARAANERKRLASQSADGVRILNSRERKRARWQQRNQEKKRQKLEQQACTEPENTSGVAAEEQHVHSH